VTVLLALDLDGGVDESICVCMIEDLGDAEEEEEEEGESFDC